MNYKKYLLLEAQVSEKKPMLLHGQWTQLLHEKRNILQNVFKLLVIEPIMILAHYRFSNY